MNKENLEGIVSKLKEQGIKAGELEKERILESANKQAEEILNKAQQESAELIESAKAKIDLLEQNSNAALKQASRDFIEATKISTLKHLENIFSQQCESLLTEEQYLKEILNAVIQSISGGKTINVPEKVAKNMEAFILKKGLSEQVEIKPIPGKTAKIVVNSKEKEGMQFVMNSKDIGEGLFSLLNKDLIKRITQNQEE